MELDYENQTPLIEALIKARNEFEPITKDGKANYGRYATYDNIVKCTDKGLQNNGLNIKHETDWIDGKQFVVSTLRHISGCKPDTSKTCTEEFIKDNKGSLIQQFGGILTYLKRYHMGLLLSLAIDEDMDSNGKQTQTGKPAPPQSDKGNGKPDKSNDVGEEVDPVFAQFKADIERIDNITHLENWKVANELALVAMKDGKEKDDLRILYSAKMKVLKAQYAKKQADKHDDPTA